MSRGVKKNRDRGREECVCVCVCVCVCGGGGGGVDRKSRNSVYSFFYTNP